MSPKLVHLKVPKRYGNAKNLSSVDNAVLKLQRFVLFTSANHQKHEFFSISNLNKIKFSQKKCQIKHVFLIVPDAELLPSIFLERKQISKFCHCNQILHYWQAHTLNFKQLCQKMWRALLC